MGLVGANWTVGGKLARLGCDLKGNPFKAMVDLIPHKGLNMKHDISTRGITESMLHFQMCVSTLVYCSFLLLLFIFIALTLPFLPQAFVKSLLIYNHFRNVSKSTDEAKSLKKKLDESEKENALLKEALARQDMELLTNRMMSEVQCKASEASMARDRAESRLAKLSNKHNKLKAEHAQLQEDHSFIKEDLGQLEEKHSETIEQLKMI